MIELNERQISICEDLGLPTTIDKLTLSQSERLSRIETLLSYLENKYGETFYYAGYYPQFLEEEKLEAYSDRTSEYDCLTLTVQVGETYIDDYSFQIVKGIVKDDIEVFLKSATMLDFKAYVIAGETRISDVDQISLSSIRGTTWVSMMLFACKAKGNPNAQALGERITEWYSHAGVYGSANLVVLDEELFETITYANFHSIRRKYGVNNFVSCSIKATGEVCIE